MPNSISVPPASSIARLMQSTADQRSILHGRPPELPLLPWASERQLTESPIYIGSEGREQPRRLTLHCRRSNTGERVQPCIFRCPPTDRRNAAPHTTKVPLGFPPSLQPGGTAAQRSVWTWVRGSWPLVPRMAPRRIGLLIPPQRSPMGVVDAAGTWQVAGLSIAVLQLRC